MIDWIIILVAVASLAAGYGLFKVNPLVGGIAGILTLLLVVSIMLSAVFSMGGFFAFLTTGWALWGTIFATSYTVGSVLGAIF